MVKISEFNVENPRFVNLTRRKAAIPQEVIDTVSGILNNVKNNGDDALYEYMKKFDGVDINEIGLLVSQEEFDEAEKKVSLEFKEAVKHACDNLFAFHKRQLQSNFVVDGSNDVVLERRYRPLENVAVTVPGDMAPLLSTLYMNLVPAIVAGVPNIYILTKPQKTGKINEHLLYVANYLNVKNVYKISGAQGLAAVAYGTRSVKKVDAIVGPGNNYTQMAKKMLYGEVKIDSVAGPSEIAIIADESANAKYIAADMLSQAEHGTGFEASTTFCLSAEMANKINDELKLLMEKYDLSYTKKSLDNYGDIFIVKSIEEAVQAVNMIAPEHVEVLTQEEEYVLDNLINAGAIFVGEYSTEPVGDYFCGTNHVLPTCGTARFSSGLSVLDFMRGYSIIKYTEDALMSNHSFIEKLALTEGMKAHALAVKVRTE